MQRAANEPAKTFLVSLYLHNVSSLVMNYLCWVLQSAWTPASLTRVLDKGWLREYATATETTVAKLFSVVSCVPLLL